MMALRSASAFVVLVAALWAVPSPHGQPAPNPEGGGVSEQWPPPLAAAPYFVLKGRLFDGATLQVIEEGVVVVAGDRVKCSGRWEDCAWPDSTPVHAFPGATILPGMIDLHVHARPGYVGAFLPAGVTTVRDLNNDLGTVEGVRESPGAPRIIASGPLMDGPGSFLAQLPFTHPGPPGGDVPPDRLMPIVVDDGETARRAVGFLVESGAEVVKIYEQMEPSVFRTVVREARLEGVPVAVDLGTAFTRGLSGAAVDIVEAAESGVSTVEHLSGLALAYQRRGGDVGEVRVDTTIVRAIADRLLATETSFVPTLAVPLQFLDQGAVPVGDLPGVSDLGEMFDAHWATARSMAEQGRGMLELELRLIKALIPMLKDGGARIGAGSDTPAAPGMLPGWALHQELEAMVRFGFTPLEALAAATGGAGAILSREDLGHLREGAMADILVVRGDPTQDILATREVEAVWLGGRRVDLAGAWVRVEARVGAPGTP